jgi:hypothetical protein
LSAAATGSCVSHLSKIELAFIGAELMKLYDGDCRSI